MDFLEKNLEDIIYETALIPSKWDFVSNRGLLMCRPYKIIRQARIGNYGIADIITLTREELITITIWELKLGAVGPNTLLQLVRYIKGVKHWFDTYRKDWEEYYQIKGIIIGKSIDTQGDYLYLSEYFEQNNQSSVGAIDYYTYNYAFDGIRFQAESLSDYRLSNPGF